jgi:hypothetical protein
MNQIKKCGEKHKKDLKDIEKQKTLKYQDDIKEIWERERKGYYEIARELFHSAMKQGKLSREQILHVRRLLEDSLGNYVHDFDDYYKVVKKGNKEVKVMGFENDCHRIYTYMKSYHISVEDWQRIIDFLNKVAA